MIDPAEREVSEPQRVASSAEVSEGGRLIVDVDGSVVGIFRVGGVLYAYENVCAHQGGPACQGRLVDRVVERLDEQQRSLGQTFDPGDPHVVCPWHGFEYSIRTGRHVTVPRYRLRAFAVQDRDGEIFVSV